MPAPSSTVVRLGAAVGLPARVPAAASAACAHLADRFARLLGVDPVLHGSLDDLPQPAWPGPATSAVRRVLDAGGFPLTVFADREEAAACAAAVDHPGYLALDLTDGYGKGLAWSTPKNPAGLQITGYRLTGDRPGRADRSGIHDAAPQFWLRPYQPALARPSVFHLALLPDWQQAVTVGEYTVSTRGLSLAEVGFIHASTMQQVEGTHRRFYADCRSPLLLLEIDTTRLGGTPLRWDPVAGTWFPHLYGALAVDSVIAARRYPAED